MSIKEQLPGQATVRVFPNLAYDMVFFECDDGPDGEKVITVLILKGSRVAHIVLPTRS